MREKILFDDVLKKIPNKYILTIVTEIGRASCRERVSSPV